MKAAILIIMIFSVVFTACSSVDIPDVLSTEDEYSVRVWTHENVYKPENNRLQVGVIFENTGGKPVYLAPGGNKLPFYILQKKEGNEWIAAYNTPVLQILTAPTKVEPGERIERQLSFINTDKMSSYPLWKITVLTGTYRLVATVLKEVGTEDEQYSGIPLPLDQRLSNTFEIEN